MTEISKALRSAVHQHSASSAIGIQQRLFSFWFNSFIYNQIWEDPAVDLAALEVNSDSRILTIASGGCNALNYLVAEPAAITAIDLNPYHLSLTRLKLAAMQHLPDHEHFYDFFGHANQDSNIDHYRHYIKPHLEKELDTFWDGGFLGIGRKRINMFRNDLYQHTRFGYFMRLLHWIARLAKHDPQQLLQAKDLDEQKAVFDQHIAPFFDNKFVRVLGKLPISVFSLGIPPQQYKVMKEEGNLIEQYRERVERLACHFPIQDNYFAWQGFGHRYDHEKRQAIPDYLKAQHYEQIKGQMHKVNTHLGSMITFLAGQALGSFDRFVFLDAQDWMTDAVLTELWTEIARVAKPESRIIFRTAAASSPIENALPNELLQQFHYEAEESARLQQQDRSAIYGGFHLYRKVK